MDARAPFLVEPLRDVSDVNVAAFSLAIPADGKSCDVRAVTASVASSRIGCRSMCTGSSAGLVRSTPGFTTEEEWTCAGSSETVAGPGGR